MAYIVENGKRINYEAQDGNLVFSDGKIAVPSVYNIDPKQAYKTASKPTGPVIITPGVKEIGPADLVNLKDVENQIFKLKPGIYTGSNRIANLKNVTIDGAGKVLFQGGAHAIDILGAISGLTLANFSTKDVSDKQISMEDIHEKRWKDGQGDFVDGVNLINIHSEGGGNLFHANGALEKGTHRGLIKGFTMRGCTVKNSAKPGMVVYLGSAMGYDISGNLIDNLNHDDTVHNGLFMLRGNGRFYGNKATNYQGTFMRAWLFSHNSTPDVVEIFNNIAYNSKKYGPFELQAAPEFHDNNFRPANAKVYNNTAGKLNTSKDWHGQMLDVYNTGGTLEYFNNLGFEMNRSIGGPSITTGITDMINYVGGSPNIIRNENNRYFNTAGEAVTDTINFKSLIKGIGAQ
ncbi:hypothetical protein [Pedobacter africanus]|uniref:Right handed beta helix region n=1 Tax=Pedobacter africanus TaxID=151894 RepID=A0A1W1ZC88_9SPHI|nr:hypothetical protein [Pedobacter africanus]SMC45658.1 hypothetical protein SAMN04488524_0556 [Pedobacter africanus]